MLDFDFLFSPHCLFLSLILCQAQGSATEFLLKEGHILFSYSCSSISINYMSLFFKKEWILLVFHYCHVIVIKWCSEGSSNYGFCKKYQLRSNCLCLQIYIAAILQNLMTCTSMNNWITVIGLLIAMGLRGWKEISFVLSLKICSQPKWLSHYGLSYEQVHAVNLIATPK